MTSIYCEDTCDERKRGRKERERERRKEGGREGGPHGILAMWSHLMRTQENSLVGEEGEACTRPLGTIRNSSTTQLIETDLRLGWFWPQG